MVNNEEIHEITRGKSVKITKVYSESERMAIEAVKEHYLKTDPSDTETRDRLIQILADIDAKSLSGFVLEVQQD